MGLKGSVLLDCSAEKTRRREGYYLSFAVTVNSILELYCTVRWEIRRDCRGLRAIRESGNWCCGCSLANAFRVCVVVQTGLTVDGINGGPSFLVAFWLWACRLGIFLGLGARCLGVLVVSCGFLWLLGAVEGFGGCGWLWVVHSSGGGDVPVACACMWLGEWRG